ncbi:hypothetical protein BGZ98_004454, partial [Dissophora globulifera]
MTDNRLSLFCLVDGDATSFSIKIPLSDTVDDLKKAIKDEIPDTFNGVDSKNLALWRVSIPVPPKKDRKHISLSDLPSNSREELDETDDVADVFADTPPKKTIHIIVQRPPSSDLRADIKKIADKFFATGSKHADFLDAYVRGEFKLPVTTNGVRGLPKVLRRGIVDTLDSGPSLLFLDLPDPPLRAGDPVPERFRSNILFSVLDGMQAQDLPVFGVSGCGKTRSMIEVLCLQWGFYFNASKNDLGSDDLYRLADFVNDKTSENTVSANTLFAKNMTLLLFLSRLLILNYCLRVPGCRQTFSSARWALLQICPNMFKDVFLGLFRKLYDQMKERTILGSVLASIVRDEFVSVREKLADHDYPNFSSESKLRLVVDEAQILSDKSPTSFESSSTQSNLRPMLSPILHGFRTTGDRGELTIIYSGTGLSIRTLHWAMSSGDGIKEYGSNIFPYVEFPGWSSPASPGRIELGEETYAENSTGKIFFQNTKYDSVTCKYCLYYEDAKEITLENEVQLVEAAFGRIKIFGGTARTVLDEPFVLKATFNYFREKDPSLVSAAERAMLHSDNASVHGSMWETMMPLVFVETFKSRPLSLWPLLANSSLPDQLTGDVTIVGYDEQQPKLAASHRNLTTQQFMKAHVENNSKQGDQDIPPFYFPAPHISGPDIVFY